MLDFDSMNLPDVPQQVIDTMKNRRFCYFVRPGISQEIPFDKLLNPCVVFRSIDTSVDPSLIMLVLPCNAIHEYN